jgi:hypothetical protein
MVGSLLVVVVDGVLVGGGLGQRIRPWGSPTAFAVFGVTVSVCSREDPSGGYLPSFGREGLGAVLDAGQAGADGRGGADHGRLQADVTPGPERGWRGDEHPDP